MRRYPVSIQSYVIEERKQGKPWKDIGQEVKSKFGVEAPTVRAMQGWVQRGLDRAQIDRMLAEEAKAKLPQAADFTQKFFSEVMLPAAWRSQAIGADLERTVWSMFLGAMETTLGSDKFEAILNEYMRQRASVKGQVAGFFSSALEKSKLEKTEEAGKNERPSHQT